MNLRNSDLKYYLSIILFFILIFIYKNNILELFITSDIIDVSEMAGSGDNNLINSIISNNTDICIAETISASEKSIQITQEFNSSEDIIHDKSIKDNLVNMNTYSDLDIPRSDLEELHIYTYGHRFYEDSVQNSINNSIENTVVSEVHNSVWDYPSIMYLDPNERVIRFTCALVYSTVDALVDLNVGIEGIDPDILDNHLDSRNLANTQEDSNILDNHFSEEVLRSDMNHLNKVWGYDSDGSNENAAIELETIILQDINKQITEKLHSEYRSQMVPEYFSNDCVSDGSDCSYGSDDSYGSESENESEYLYTNMEQLNEHLQKVRKYNNDIHSNLYSNHSTEVPNTNNTNSSEEPNLFDFLNEKFDDDSNYNNSHNSNTQTSATDILNSEEFRRFKSLYGN